MLTLEPTGAFRKDYKLCKKRNYDMSRLEIVIECLLSEKELDAKHRDHALTGNMAQYRECHIQSDWLLVYRIESTRLVLVASRTGTHSDLFK